MRNADLVSAPVSLARSPQIIDEPEGDSDDEDVLKLWIPERLDRDSFAKYDKSPRVYTTSGMSTPRSRVASGITTPVFSPYGSRQTSLRRQVSIGDSPAMSSYGGMIDARLTQGTYGSSPNLAALSSTGVTQRTSRPGSMAYPNTATPTVEISPGVRRGSDSVVAFGLPTAQTEEAVDTNSVSKTFINGRTVINQYLVCGKLGQGSYGKVLLVIDVNTNIYYAMKIINKSRLQRKVILKKNRDPTTHMDYVRREIAIMKKLRHPNVVSLHEVIEDSAGDGTVFKQLNLYIVMEYVQNGCIASGSECVALTEDECRRCFRDVVAGLHYIHSQGVMHADIKPENLLVDQWGNVKITDFGISLFLNPEDDANRNSANNVKTTPAFLAPEGTEKTEFEKTKLDVWALGITLYMLAHGKCPFVGHSVMDTFKKTRENTLKLDASLSDSMRDLLYRLLDKDPTTRITIEECMTHPWVLVDGPMPILSFEPIPESREELVSQEEKKAAINEVQLDFADLVKIKMTVRKIVERLRSRANSQSGPESTIAFVPGIARASDAVDEDDTRQSAPEKSKSASVGATKSGN